MSSAHSKVLETPELLSLICSNAQLGTCATLLRVNKSNFRAAVPFVWSSVGHVSHLLQLIPGFADSGVLALPPFASADFTRFAVYAQYVRSLAVDCRLRVTPWKTLILQSKRQHLLPRLISLSLWQDGQRDFVTEGVAWMSVLLTPSLTSIDIRKIGSISTSGISVLLHMISNSCLGVRELYLPSVLESTELEDGEHHLLDILPSRPLPGSFLGLSNLCALTSSHWVLRPEYFQAIGDLPQLESLELFSEPYTIDPPRSVSELHKNSFPALKRLSLKQFSWNRIGIVLKHQLLIKNIVSLELVAIVTSDTWEEADAALLALAHIKGLTHLVIDFNDQDYYEILVDDPALEVLSQLPLRSVKLVQAQFMDNYQTHLPRIFPTLTELHMPDQSADLDDFSRFATIPNLKHLVVRTWDLSVTDLTASVELPVCPSLDTLQLATELFYPFPVQDVHIIARYFLKLFPNLKNITWLKGNEDTIADRDMTLLNAYIATLRERNNARARIAEQCGWDVANRLLPDNDESIKPVL